MSVKIVTYRIMPIKQQNFMLPTGAEILSATPEPSGKVCIHTLDWSGPVGNKDARRQVVALKPGESYDLAQGKELRLIDTLMWGNLPGLVVHVFEVVNAAA